MLQQSRQELVEAKLLNIIRTDRQLYKDMKGNDIKKELC